MVAKLKCKTHLLNRFFDFLSRFLRVWLQSLKKVLIWPKKNFFVKNQKRCQKTQNSTLILNPLKKLWKNAQKKDISKTSLTNMSKSEKSAFSVRFLLITFFWYIFSKLFQRIRNQREILGFLTPFSILKKKILCHISTFFELWLQMRRKRLKKTENLFLWMCLRI